MPPIYTPQSLTRRLVSYNTVNPPGNEQECATFIGDLLSAGGFDVGYHEFTPRRTSLVARKIFNFLQVQGNRRHCAEAYSCAPHKPAD
ncbi:MAG: hypothetical protein WBR24_00920 [Desulfobacterales bacterium]